MATHETLTSLFSDVASAIRGVDGTTDPIVADDFPDRIRLFRYATGMRHSFDLTDLSAIKKISEAGEATKYFSEGDQIVVQYTDVNGNVYSMPWDMILGKTATLADGTVREGIYLKSHYATVESIQYDAPEQEVTTDTVAAAGMYYYANDYMDGQFLDLATGEELPYEGIYEGAFEEFYYNAICDTTAQITQGGYNRYSHSAIHQWLNSTAGKGDWWTAAHVGDSAPSALSSYNGFMAGLPADFLSLVETVQFGRTLNTVSEPDKSLGTEIVQAKFFLPSLEQCYITPELAGVEGDAWNYYKALAEEAGLTGQFQPYSTYPALIHYALNSQTTAQMVCLGSTFLKSSMVIWVVDANGKISYHNPNTAFRVTPVCFI
jgi:hypothetical protein